MSLSSTNDYLTELINAGADAVSNLYYLQFTGGLVESKGVGTGLTIRSSQITLPKFTHTTNTVHFMTTSADMPKAEISGKKEISLTIRVDANYEIYKYLLEQQKLTSLPDFGYAATVVPDEVESDNYFKLSVYSMGSAVQEQAQEQLNNDYTIDESLYQKMYEFRYCWIKAIDRPRFTYDSASAQTVNVKIGFYDYDDPQSLLK